MKFHGNDHRSSQRQELEPDKQEPLRPRSQSPPRVTGAVTANRRRCHEPLRPIPAHSGLRAPSRPRPMGKSGRRALPPGPQPPPRPPPAGGARPIGQGPRRVELGPEAGWARVDQCCGPDEPRRGAADSALGARSLAWAGL